MASALQNVSALGNPNDRRRINLIARYALDTGTSPEAAVATWLSEKKEPSAKRTISRTAKYGPGARALGVEDGQARGKRFKETGGMARFPDPETMTKEEKKARDKRKREYAKIKMAVARAFEKADPFAYGENYAKAALRSHASRYRKINKKETLAQTVHGKQFMLWGKPAKEGRTVVRVKGDDGVAYWSKKRRDRRADGDWGKSLDNKGEILAWLKKKEKFARGLGIDYISRYDVDPEGHAVLRSGQKSWKEISGGKIRRHKIPKIRRTAAQRKKSQEFFDKKKAERKAKTNGGSALMNPQVNGVVPFLTGYVAPVTLAGVAGGSAHLLADRIGVTDFVANGVEMIPGVGSTFAKYGIHIIQGALVGTVLGFAASKTEGQVSKALAYLAGGVVVAGGVMDAPGIFNGVLGLLGMGDESDTGALAFGDLAFTNTSALGDLAFTNTGDLGDLGAVAFGAANPGFKVASLSVEDYAQSSLGDALYSGADFSGVEGQALVNGKPTFLARFGIAPTRAAGRMANRESHLAGREGHRWGWLVKMIGWERARRIASLAPKQRLVILAKLRKAAIAAFQQSVATDLAAQAVASAQLSSGSSADLDRAHQLAQAANAGVTGVSSDLVLPAAGQVLSGAGGAGGASCANGSELAGMDYLGDPTLFMGA